MAQTAMNYAHEPMTSASYKYIEQIYHAWVFGRGICEKYQSSLFSLKTGIFRKYPSQYDIYV
jgi:hypothetical protein